MSEPTSRQALEEALAWLNEEPGGIHPKEVVADAARAILDAPRFPYCETHGAEQYPGTTRGHCWQAREAALGRPCQFATYVRVKVAG